MSYFHRAIIKYGKESFYVEKIYELSDTENLNWSQVEKQFISKYNSNLKEVGYNLTDGGENPPKTCGEKNVQATLSDKEFYEILDLIKENQITLTEIAKRYNVSNDTIERINMGKIRFQNDLTYPIRKYSIDELKAIQVVKFLIHTDLKYSIISKIVEVGERTPVTINTGHTQSKLFPNIKYPIRNNLEYNKQFYLITENDKYLYCKLKFQDCNKYERRALLICKDLINKPNLKMSHIAKTYKINTSIIYQINLGKTYKTLLNIFTFPIRNNIDINKKILDEIEAVETIPLIGK